ncbi:hypothetical protein JMJ35_009186 [Cladonia borealis]|uniref:Uncharacterized protein n=1 Tax=Cladonia borealis TaxID=184061 RepID=A0AA39QS03_9LECA|nr:hypothetical protein JMJ35_009186 [Cladonia borealis]
MVQWGPGPDALFMVTMMKVHSVKPNYPAIAANMGDNFTHRALGHRMDTLRNMAEKYLSTMALQAQAGTTQDSPTVPAKENKRGSSAAASSAKAKSTPTTPTKTNNDKATTKTSATKNKATKTTPVKAKTNAGVKKRTAPAVGAKGKMGIKAEANGKKVEDKMNAEGDNTDATITDGEADTQGEDGEWEADKMEVA